PPDGSKDMERQMRRGGRTLMTGDATSQRNESQGEMQAAFLLQNSHLVCGVITLCAAFANELPLAYRIQTRWPRATPGCHRHVRARVHRGPHPGLPDGRVAHGH